MIKSSGEFKPKFRKTETSVKIFAENLNNLNSRYNVANSKYQSEIVNSRIYFLENMARNCTPQYTAKFGERERERERERESCCLRRFNS